MRRAWLPLVLLIAVHATVRADVGVTVDVHVALPPPPPPPPPLPPPAPPPPPPTAILVDVPPPGAPEPAVVAAPPPPPESHSHPATLGLELTAVNGRVFGWGASMGTGVAVVLHPLDAYPLDIGIDYRRDVFLSDPDGRIDHRINYTLYLGPQAPALAPYVAIPMGVDIVTRSEMPTVVEGFVGIGVGGRWRITDHFTVRADARIETRGQENDKDHDPDPTLPVNETAVSAQMSAGYYF
jgi:hypothetical protein